jgi:hypothetical protein
MGEVLEKAVADAEKENKGFVACSLDFGPDCAGLDVPLAKATKFCPKDVPSAVFAISDNHIVGRCVVPKVTCLLYPFKPRPRCCRTLWTTGYQDARFHVTTQFVTTSNPISFL